MCLRWALVAIENLRIAPSGSTLTHRAPVPKALAVNIPALDAVAVVNSCRLDVVAEASSRMTKVEPFGSSIVLSDSINFSLDMSDEFRCPSRVKVPVLM